MANKKLIHFSVTLQIIFFTAICSAQDVALSWANGHAFLPGEPTPTSLKNIKNEKKLPVVIYLHGCTGVYPPHDFEWAKEISKNGFIVIIPDSMARENRKSNCDPRVKGGTNAFPMAYKYRQEEITYAFDQLLLSAWADERNLFLMGHSEGGIATAQSKHVGFKGKIISAWTCTQKNNPSFGSIQSPKEVPLLAVAYLDDAWRKGKPTEGRCIDSAEGRNLTQIDLVGIEHSTFSNATARKEVIKFLLNNSMNKL